MPSNRDTEQPGPVMDQTTRSSGVGAQTETKQDDSKPSRLKRAWGWLRLDLHTFLLMIKSAIAPTIALAMCQANVVAIQYGTIGYLIAIAAVLGLPILPRAKFIQTMMLDVLAICVATAINLLALVSIVRARLNTTPPGAPTIGYNSSASAVSAIWLFFQTYLANTVRSARPQLQLPAVMYTIFVVVAMSYAPNFPDMSSAISFAKTLLATFLAGLGLATGVSLIIYPVSSRKVVLKEMTGYLAGLRNLISTQLEYMQSLENANIFKIGQQDQPQEQQDKRQFPASSVTQQAVALRGAVSQLQQLHGKLNADLTSAKREVAWGKLHASDLDDISRLLREAFLPLYGMSSITDIFQRVTEAEDWDKPAVSAAEPRREKVSQDWKKISEALHEPFQTICQDMDSALEHVMLVLEFKKTDKKVENADVEARGGKASPGDKNYSTYYDRRTQEFYESRKITFQAWCELNGMNGPDKDWIHEIDQAPDDHRQLFLALYMEYLLWTSSRAIYNLVLFADLKSGTTKKSHLIVPAYQMIRTWITGITHPEDVSNDDHYVMEAYQSASEIYLGDAFSTTKDPEHLPPTTLFQKLGNYLIKFPKGIRSTHSLFGFRVACATMSVGIVAYLQASHLFFIEQRLLWAMIMVALSMSRTAGQSLINFVLRVLGTVTATIAVYIVWYIVDGTTPGVIVFVFIWLALSSYFVIKFPQYMVVSMISTVTLVLIVGYELQSRKLGIRVATSNGQTYYPPYLLAPYRLACVTGGLTVAFFWTIFPFPVSESSELRHSLGKTLASVCRYYASIHETVKIRINATEGNMNSEDSPGRKLESSRHDAFTKSMLLVSRMKTQSQFSRWQIHMGGKFPKGVYDKIIGDVEKIINYTALLGFASTTFERAEGTEDKQWLADFRNLLGSVPTTSHEVTTILSLLSSAVMNAHPLPPYTKAPESFGLLKRLEGIDKDILSIRHIDEPGYSAFAVMQIAGRIIISDLGKLIEKTKELVGELDFSFYAAQRANESDGESGKGA